MSSNKQIKSCLVITYGPVPTPEYQTIEGGGMRAWGLAQGLVEQGIDVTVGINASFPQSLTSHENVRLINWSLDDRFATAINSYDAVVMSYCMGDPSVFVVSRIADNVQLILDAYVPIYVEVSARESKDADVEYVNYMSDITHFNKVLKRGDYFLCANEAQKTFYTGVLSALSIINPRSYREDRLLIVPFGIHDVAATSSENPYIPLRISKNDFVVLWFGGLYPWFHVEELLGALKTMSKHAAIKFVFVGGKNPFNPNPDFFTQYEKTVAFAQEHKLTNKSVFFVDWVDFEDRINWYEHADVVISLNRPGEENKYSWRTRVMDYVWGELPIITNGGDPLSEDLIREGAAIRLKSLSSSSIVQSIEDVYNNKKLLSSVKQRVIKLKPRYYWRSVTKPLADIITGESLPYSEEFNYRQKLNLTEAGELSNLKVTESKVSKVIRLPARVVRHARKKGLKRSVKLAVGITKTQFNKYASRGNKQRYVFISHPIDNTGAPLVLLEMVEEFAKKYGSTRIKLIAPGIKSEQLRKLQQIGVHVDKAAIGLGFRLIRLQLGLSKNDFVLMNTVAIYDNYRDFVLLWLRTGRLKHAYWFIHEDQAQLPVIHKEFLDEANLSQMHKLMQKGSLTLLTPSKRTRNEYVELLKSSNVRAVDLHVEVDETYKQPRKSSDYETIDFLLSGTPSDGRKGQLLALSAFYSFLKDSYEKNPTNYRKFKLHLVAIGKDYLSQQISWISDSLLEEFVTLHPSMPKEQALEITAECNAVICCSLNETFGLYIAEGMYMGHVVLRNNSAGVDEQLREEVNGYFIDHTDIQQFAGVIEEMLNKSKTRNSDLLSMGQASQKIIQEFGENSYVDQILQVQDEDINSPI